MDPPVVSLARGQRFSIVALVEANEDGVLRCTGISPEQQFMVKNAQGIGLGKHTFYDLVKGDGEDVCGVDHDTVIHFHAPYQPFQTISIMDFCCGMGGFTLGSSRLGMHTVAFVDKSPLACQAVHSNFKGQVIQGDIGDVNTMKQVHAHRCPGPLQVTGGFACQGFSTQGDQQGMRDRRSHSLMHILQGAWYLQADDILLECVANVVNFPAAQGVIDRFAECTDMKVCRLTFDLKDQWPARRNRFWCHLSSSWLPYVALHAWPPATDRTVLGDIMPMTAVWTEHDEEQLLWDETEQALFLDELYGLEKRILEATDQAPTVLHSWGHITRDCACGCRRAFSLSRLQQGGVRGFGFISSVTQRPRHLHPQEGSVLCTVMPDYDYPLPLRSALCLLGQIAAPLQVLWIQAQIISGYQQHFWGETSISPLDQIAFYKHELCLHAFTRWITPTMFTPRTIQVQLEGEETVMNVQIQEPTTVSDLQMAEKRCGNWGDYTIVKHMGIRLPSKMQLFPGVVYQLQRCTPKQLKPAPMDIYGAGPATGGEGLGDGVIWAFMHTMKDLAGSDVFVLHPFRAQHFIDLEIPDAVSESWRAQSLTHGLVTICEHQGHWLLLHGEWVSNEELDWTFYDGLKPEQTQIMMRAVAAKLSLALSGRLRTFTQGLSIPQQHPQVCGTVALMNFGHLLHLERDNTDMGILDIHQELLLLQQMESAPQSHIYAEGDNWRSRLRDLLKDKGVPSQALEDRCQTVTTKLGVNQIQAILRKKNPWMELKAAASKPGSMFRLVTQAELKDYIDARAQTKHGAQIRNHKQKKTFKPSERHAPVHLDPEQFELNANHFKDDDDLPVGQIAFDEVIAEARGVALCNVGMARSFLEQPLSISTDALALLLVDTPTDEIIDRAKLQKIVIPAKFRGTDEHTLIYGYIMQLGDSDVSREDASTNSSPDVIQTQVIKLQVFRDQLSLSWQRFQEAPIRALVATMEPLQLCRGANCGASCGKYHPAVDETVDNVIFELWARSYFDDNGRKTTPAEATLFTAFLRIPESAVEKLIANTPLGVYVEPRGERPKEHDDKFRVIWLPGASAEDAVHQSRTFDKTVSLVRLKNKFGIRVKKEDETAAWAHLRPGTQFTPLTLQYIFELFPIPHGTQRNAIVKLLADWKWLARPLQPGRGSSDYMAWRVGAQTPPPQGVMTGFQNDVVITQVKELKHDEPPKQMVASTKTQRQLRAACHGTQARGSNDPWQTDALKDPWHRFTPSTAGSASASDGKTKLSTLQEQLKTDLAKDLATRAQEAIQEAAQANSSDDSRITALEVGMKEIQGQQMQFATWCKQTNERFQQQENTMGAMQQTLNGHQHELQTLGTTFQSTMKNAKDELSSDMKDIFNKQFARLEALVEKKQRTESSFGFWQLLISLFLLITPVDALQYQDPFARFFVTSSAAKADRDFGSGGTDMQQVQNYDCQLSSAGSNSFSLVAKPLQMGTFRFGEALHPGPPWGEQLTVGVSNPGGVRQKEEHMLDLGPGVWSYAETQLSSSTFKTSSGLLRTLGRQRNRHIRFHGGSPAPLRAGSTWAGKWTGVAVLSDLQTQTIDLPWPQEHWDSSRVLLTRHWANDLPITVGTIYGYAQGPTWPKARQLTDQLLETFTTEVVLGMTGVRIIQGDFNQDPGDLVQHRIWQRHGWRNSQEVAAELFQHEIIPTCKGATERDQSWLSPEAIQLLRGIKIADIFADHATLMLTFQVPLKEKMIQSWPRPAKLPWEDIDIEDWHPECTVQFQVSCDSTQFLSDWAMAYEQSIDQLAHQQRKDIPRRCFGRAKRLDPVTRQMSSPICKPSS
eukprot:Skav229334  [mRNA]  locus=scaffold2596:57032:62763:+ [translate_table: standard]